MKILFIGDIFGAKGKEAIIKELPNLIKSNNIDLTIANAENCTQGRGLSVNDYKELVKVGVNYFTFGNHTWHLNEITEVLKNPNTIRPLNLKQNFKYSKVGEGTRQFTFKNKTIRITNLLGSSVICRDIQTNPFNTLEQILKFDSSDIHIVDLHAETTSEKNAFLQNFNGKVSAILGTHTHIQSADNKIINNTAYITDTGMTGPSNGVIGCEPETIVNMFKGKSDRFRLIPSTSKYQVNAVVLNFNDKTNKPTSIERIFIYEK